MNRKLGIVVSGLALCAGIAAARALPQSADSRTLLTGQAAFAAAELERPGIFRHITVADLPAPGMSFDYLCQDIEDLAVQLGV